MRGYRFEFDGLDLNGEERIAVTHIEGVHGPAPHFYLQRASRPGWVHYCRDGVVHVTTQSWRLWLWSFVRRDLLRAKGTGT